MGKKNLHRSLSVYLSKLRRTRLLLYSCNFPQEPSLALAAGGDQGATLSDVDRYLTENFGTLYSAAGSGKGNESADFTSPRLTDPPPEAVRPSKRFFVAAGPTSSLIEEARLSACESSFASAADDGGAASEVVTESVDPYVDFKTSMQEMVYARHVYGSGPLDWGFLEDLLARYLELNERSVHECIMRAFMDLTEALRRQGAVIGRRRRAMDGRRV